MSPYQKAAAVIAAALLFAPISPFVASAEKKIQEVFVTNSSNDPIPVAPALWQGTPYVEFRIQTTLDSFTCEELPIPAGMVLFVQRAVTDFNVAPDQPGSASLHFTPLGGASRSVTIPAHPGPPALQVAGLYDGYEGAVEIGQPVVGPLEVCFGAGPTSILSGKTSVIGYLVPAS